MAKVIDGKAYAEGLRGRMAKTVAELKSKHGLTPGLAVVLVGEDPASKVYVANKAKQTVEVGMNSWEHKLDAATPEATLLALVEKLNTDPACHGILAPSQRASRCRRSSPEAVTRHARLRERHQALPCYRERIGRRAPRPRSASRKRHLKCTGASASLPRRTAGCS